MAPDLLSIIGSEVDSRLNELRPLLAEYERLVVAAEALLESDDVAAIEDAVPTAARSGRPARARRAFTASVTAETARAELVEPTSGSAATETQAPKGRGKAKPRRARHEAARGAILAALEHGSHTVGELLVVTAMSAPHINGTLRRMVAEGTVAKTERDGKVAYVLPSAA